MIAPILPALAASNAAGPTGDPSFICTERGGPSTKESFGTWVGKVCREANARVRLMGCGRPERVAPPRMGRQRRSSKPCSIGPTEVGRAQPTRGRPTGLGWPARRAELSPPGPRNSVPQKQQSPPMRWRAAVRHLVPRKGLGFREKISLPINELASPAEAAVYHVCGAGFNSQPPPERSPPTPTSGRKAFLDEHHLAISVHTPRPSRAPASTANQAAWGSPVQTAEGHRQQGRSGTPGRSGARNG